MPTFNQLVKKGRRVPGKKIKTGNKILSYNPSNKEEIVSSFYKGTSALVDKAVETANKKFVEWKIKYFFFLILRSLVSSL